MGGVAFIRVDDQLMGILFLACPHEQICLPNLARGRKECADLVATNRAYLLAVSQPGKPRYSPNTETDLEGVGAFN